LSLGPNIINLFGGEITKACNKLECLSLESFSRLVYRLWVWPGVSYLEEACKHKTRLERHAKDKHSSLL
jgi:hypothetical protein